MKFFRVNRRIGMGLIVLAVIGAIIWPGARPSLHGLIVVLLVALAAGLVVGLMARRSLSLDKRLRLAHRVSPRLARHVLPPASDDNEAHE
jgi:hypothetical protein